MTDEQDSTARIDTSSSRILLMVSGGLDPFLQNVLAGIRACNIAPAAVCLLAPAGERRRHEGLLARGMLGEIVAIEDLAPAASLDRHGGYHEFGTPGFGRLTAFKWLGIKYLLAKGARNVVYSDVDVAWRRDPLPLLLAIHQFYEVCLQTEGVVAFPPPFCTGFMSFRNSKFCLDFLDHLLQAQLARGKAEPQAHDQIVFNDVVVQNSRLITSIFPLSEILFANGLLARSMGAAACGELGKLTTGEADPMIFHANWTIGLPNKQRLLELTGNWIGSDARPPAGDLATGPVTGHPAPPTRGH